MLDQSNTINVVRINSHTYIEWNYCLHLFLSEEEQRHEPIVRPVSTRMKSLFDQAWEEQEPKLKRTKSWVKLIESVRAIGKNRVLPRKKAHEYNKSFVALIGI